MSKKAFDKIAEGLTEALAIARREEARQAAHPAGDRRARHPRAHRPVAGRLRDRLRLHHQPDQGLGAGPRATVGGVRAYLIIIERDAKRVLELLRKTRKAA